MIKNLWGERIDDEKTPITNLITLQKVLGKYKPDNDYEYFFRGEAKDYKETSLLPNVFRDYIKDQNLESSLYYDALTNFPDEYSNLSNLSKLSKMQHYDYPTRLLDLTTNPLVALWFACADYDRANNSVGTEYFGEEASKYKTDKNKKSEKLIEEGCFYVIKVNKKLILNCDSDRALLLACLAKLDNEKKIKILKLIETIGLGDKKRINTDYFKKLKKEKKLSKKEVEELQFAFENYIAEANRERAAFANYNTVPDDLLKTFVVRPMIENQRQKEQRGLFAIFGLETEESDTRFDDLIKKDITISRYKIPVQDEKNDTLICKKSILQQLDLYNINHATIFADMASRSKYIIKKIKASSIH